MGNDDGFGSVVFVVCVDWRCDCGGWDFYYFYGGWCWVVVGVYWVECVVGGEYWCLIYVVGSNWKVDL